MFEYVPGRHRHDTRSHTFSDELLVRFHSETNFTPRSDENHFWILACGVSEYVCSPRNSRCWRVLLSIQSRQGLTRQHQNGGFVTQLHDVTVGFDNFVGVTGSQSDEAWDGPQRSKMLDRLMGWTIFAVAHRVVCKNKDGRQFHQSR